MTFLLPFFGVFFLLGGHSAVYDRSVVVLMSVLGAEAAAGITRRGRATPRGPGEEGGGVSLGP